ncbi:MAG: preprotein translocase subunit SecG [Ignavibacteriae bacterium]|nr:preprotein translocase subunit SecG [Ignavibacteriota bacterium]
MYTILITLSIIIAVLLVIVVLLQASKGDGLSGTIGGGAGGFGTAFGARRTADFLSKATWWLGGSLMALAVVINLFFLPGQTTSGERESIIQSSGAQTVPSDLTLPEQTTPQQEAPVEETKLPEPQTN